GPGSKADVFRRRLHLLLARTARHRRFAVPLLPLGSAEQQQYTELTPVQALVGGTAVSQQRRHVAGVLSQLEDGRFFLEDLAAALPLDLAHATPSIGYFTENSVVIAAGQLTPSGCFKVTSLEFPPLEPREEALSLAEGFDFFGAGPIDSDRYAWIQQREAEGVSEGVMFIVIAGIALDHPQTLSRLATVFSGYDAMDPPPRLFLLLGDFFTTPWSLASHQLHAHREAFAQLARIIASNRRLKEKSLFVFVPGQGDPGPCSVLPRPPLPRFFTDPITDALPSALFTSNPSRLKFFCQEVVILRSDLQRHMQRCAVLPPLKDAADPFTHLATTVVHQAHLSPLPLTSQPVFWDYDFTLHLFPAPHVLILADAADQGSTVVNDVTCINPGSFSLDGTFTAYYPATRTVEHCNV
ncbi:hypothetical protein CLOP_g8319, partial [Closterium sp. NIES-67]